MNNYFLKMWLLIFLQAYDLLKELAKQVTEKTGVAGRISLLIVSGRRKGLSQLYVSRAMVQL